MLDPTVSHYRIEELIGEGGMGVVYRAHDLTLNRAVAVKFLSLMAADGDRRRRFQFEAEAASSLNHPHILSVFEVGTHDGKPYFVTEFVHGSTLREWVRQVTPSVLQAVARTLVPVAEALATAHQAGLVHRDIKPENVLVAKAGYGKLADFGLAKVVDTSAASAASTATVTVPGVVLGTVAYMSPEQAAGATVDHRSDIFSFGVMTYQRCCVVCGRSAAKPTSTCSTRFNASRRRRSQITGVTCRPSSSWRSRKPSKRSRSIATSRCARWLSI